MTIVGFLLMLLVAAACAAIGSALVPGVIPGGFLVAAIIGLIGSYIGTAMFSPIGPVLVGVPLVNAIVGSGLLVFLLALVTGYRSY